MASLEFFHDSVDPCGLIYKRDASDVLALASFSD